MITTLFDKFKSGDSLLSSQVREQLVFRCRGRLERKCGSKMAVNQNPVEAIGFLNFLRDNEVARYSEVGCAYGGMWCIVDSFLRANFDNVITIGVDIKNVLDNYEPYHEKFEQCRFELTTPDTWVPDEYQDVIFIDTNQGLDATMAEAMRLREHADYLAFHDVDDNRWGSSAFWYNGEADLWGKIDHFHYGEPMLGGPGIGVVRCLPDLTGRKKPRGRTVRSHQGDGE